MEEMGGENLGRELLNALGLGAERAVELMDKLLDLAVKHETPDFLISELPEILKMAETPEETFFVGFFGAMVSTAISLSTNPLETLAGATHTMEVLAERKAKKTAKN